MKTIVIIIAAFLLSTLNCVNLLEAKKMSKSLEGKGQCYEELGELGVDIALIAKDVVSHNYVNLVMVIVSTIKKIVQVIKCFKNNINEIILEDVVGKISNMDQESQNCAVTQLNKTKDSLLGLSSKIGFSNMTEMKDEIESIAMELIQNLQKC